MSIDQQYVMPKCPPGLSREARVLWRDVCNEFLINTATQKLFLRTACESLDRLRSAQRQLKADGIVSRGRYGQFVAHPALNVEKSARAALTAALQRIGFEGDIQ